MTFPLDPALAPMEAKLVASLPDEDGWQFEPKWDGFRCLAYRAGPVVELMSKSGKPLTRYFPEVAAMLGRLRSDRFVLDGELLIPLGETLSFDALQARLHPAESRIRRLAAETPAQLMLFDCLATGDEALLELPLALRRTALERLHAREAEASLLLSPAVVERSQADAWLARSGGALDGVVAKRLDQAYTPGERTMLKVKQHRSADCVVGGFRYGAAGGEVASLLLGLYGEDGLLHYVGFTSGLPAAERPALTRRLEGIPGSGFTGKAPGGPSRWTRGETHEWRPLAPELVVEVRYDQVTGGRFRHGTRLLRWRPDKRPDQCRTDQLIHELKPVALMEVIA
ncbi:ATP-dependent DNA ligase [Sphingomonas jatrophae]|uniref:DNA ligase (ATP) n=1 Tax=Sphingomonas jatrophae TaxID=1166337 RepID=A0A1I6JNT5_9SPHN|nr:ATP-dependent DNA ligase [Sphingomonas jatrophae]SFR80652.1 ATP-dependent DNA ligase [Sphingomonas jatrophae]